jgi:hypothetical protein
MEKNSEPIENKKIWVKPEIESDTVYETQALGCAQCLNRGAGTEVGFGSGNCRQLGVNNY